MEKVESCECYDMKNDDAHPRYMGGGAVGQDHMDTVSGYFCPQKRVATSVVVWR